MELNDIFDTKDYGKVILKIDKVMAKNNISVYALSKSAMLRYHIAQRYYEGVPLQRVDLGVLARICFVLGVRDMNDVIEYLPPEK